MTTNTADLVAAGLPRLIALDMDHTLLRSDRTLSTRSIDAVRACTIAGVTVCLASSRYPDAMIDYLNELDLQGLFVASQGAAVGRVVNGRVDLVSQHPIEVEAALASATAAARAGLAVNWFAGDVWYVTQVSAGVVQESAVVGRTPRVVSTFDGLPAPDKLLLISESDSGVASASDLLPASVISTTSNPHYLEVTTVGVDKATGVAEVAAELGIERSQVWAIGDGDNDLSLFAYAARAVAPANANARVLAAADAITASNDDDGVALVLEAVTDRLG